MRAMDVLVVDEAGQSTEAETCIAFLVCDVFRAYVLATVLFMAWHCA